MKNIFNKIMLLLSIIMIFCTACSEPSFANNEKPTAMGRYVEKTLKLPCENVKGVNSEIKRSDGSIDYYLLLEEIPGCVLYNTLDGVNWNKAEIPWYDEIVNMEYVVMDIAYDKNDNIYTLIAGGENWEYRIFNVTDGNKLKEVKMNWQKSDTEEQSISITNIEIAQNGDLIMSQRGKGIVSYTSDGEFKGQYGAPRNETFTISDNKLFIIDEESSAVVVYDLNTQELIKSVSYDNMTYETSLSAGKEGSIYLTDRSGVYRLAQGGSLWEKIIDGELTTLNIPSQYFSGIVEGMDDSFYIVFGDAESNCIFTKYEYDENISTLPGTELVVYTLQENKTLRQAAGELQHKNSDIKVNIKVGIDNDSSITKSDAIRALNTELLAGKGPDLILLDGMPINSYISKGVLTDLSDVLSTLEENGEDLFDNVKNTYKEDSKVFAVPTKFILPTMWIDEEYSNEMKNLKQLADFVEKHNDKQVISCSSTENLIKLFSITSFPHWIDEEGNIKEAEFIDFLKDLKRINDAEKIHMKDNITDKEAENNFSSQKARSMFDSVDSVENVFNWAFGRSYTYCGIIKGYNSVNLHFLAVKERNGGIVTPLPGQVDNVFVPINSIGVNANSPQIDIAKEFVGVMLSSSVQNAQTYDGFPINIKSLDYGAEGRGNSDKSFGVFVDSPYEEELAGALPDADELSKVKEVCLSVKTPSIVDEILLEMIINETKGYFTGEKTIEKAVYDVKEKTKLYLSE